MTSVNNISFESSYSLPNEVEDIGSRVNQNFTYNVIPESPKLNLPRKHGAPLPSKLESPAADRSSRRNSFPPLPPVQEELNFTRLKTEVSLLREDIENVRDSLKTLTDNIDDILKSSKATCSSSKANKEWKYDDETISWLQSSTEEAPSVSWKGLLRSPELQKQYDISLQSPTPLQQTKLTINKTPNTQFVKNIQGVTPSTPTIPAADDCSSLSNPSLGNIVLETHTSTLLRNLEKEMNKETERKQSIRTRLLELREQRASNDKSFEAIMPTPRKKLTFGSNKVKQPMTLRAKQRVTSYQRARMYIMGMRYSIVFIACLIPYMVIQSTTGSFASGFPGKFQESYSPAPLNMENLGNNLPSAQNTLVAKTKKQSNRKSELGQRIARVLLSNRQDDNTILETMNWF